jgi:outer membrane protein TolC
MKKYKISLLFFLFSGLHISAQNKLTIQQAIDIALQENLSISLARTDFQMAKASNTYGNAGFMPSVSFLTSTARSSYNTKQEFNTGVSLNRNNAISNSANASLAVSWTVFDGMKMFATKDRLAQLESRSEVSLHAEIENTVAKITLLYYDAVKQQQLIHAGKEALTIYEEREKIAKKKLEIGSGSKLDLLQARLDLNAQKSLLMKLNLAFENAIVALNLILTKQADSKFTVEENINIDTTLDLNGIQRNAMKDNAQLKLANNAILIANDQIKEMKSTTLPQVGVNLNYNLSQTKNQVGLILLNQNKGFNGGINISMNLFNGFKTQTQVKIAEYTLTQSTQQLNYVSSVMATSILTSWKSYKNALAILNLEEENISIARENVTVALERFRIGSSNTLELLMAQRSFEDAISRLVVARYDAKLAEAELLRLQGKW